MIFNNITTRGNINYLIPQVIQHEDPLIRMHKELIEEQDELILSCLAAGVPLNLISVTTPELRTNRQSFTTHLVSDLYFTGWI